MSLQQSKPKKRKERDENESVKQEDVKQEESACADDGGNDTIEFELLRNEEGDSYLELSKRRRVTVRRFRKNVLVDIREVYEKDGKVLPGKKGISLTEEQYEVLRDIIKSGVLDTEIQTLKA